MPQEIHFYRVHDEYGCFSNFSSHPIMLDGEEWRTTEHYFQAMKFAAKEYRVQIQQEASPMIAARMGRSRAWPLRPDWEEIKLDVMRKAVRAKVLQHTGVRELLLNTGDAILIEHTRNDAFWADGGDGHGLNMLGKILMEIREELLQEKTQSHSGYAASEG